MSERSRDLANKLAARHPPIGEGSGGTEAVRAFGVRGDPRGDRPSRPWFHDI